MGIEGALSRGVKCPDLNLATHCNLAHNLRIFGAIILFPSNAFVTCTTTTLPQQNNYNRNTYFCSNITNTIDIFSCISLRGRDGHKECLRRYIIIIIIII
jgi:hypothetical protein